MKIAHRSPKVAVESRTEERSPVQQAAVAQKKAKGWGPKEVGSANATRVNPGPVQKVRADEPGTGTATRNPKLPPIQKVRADVPIGGVGEAGGIRTKDRADLPTGFPDPFPNKRPVDKVQADRPGGIDQFPNTPDIVKRIADQPTGSPGQPLSVPPVSKHLADQPTGFPGTSPEPQVPLIMKHRADLPEGG